MCWHIRNSVVCQHFFIPILLLRHPPPPYLSSKKGKILEKFPFFQERFPIRPLTNKGAEVARQILLHRQRTAWCSTHSAKQR